MSRTFNGAICCNSWILGILILGSLLLLTPSTSAQDTPDDSGKPVIKKRTESRKKSGDDAEQEKKAPATNPFPKRIPAPDLDGGVEWLNTSGEITLKDLRGKIVLLDFWTYCCINCMHILPDLAYLEKKYPNELVVIGVHSAKFDNEKESGNIRKAIVRYEIEHPVINDADMVVWRKFEARSWPTLALIDPEGFYCGSVSGEGHRDTLDRIIGQVAAYHRHKGTLDESPVRFDLERNKLPERPLKFPGKILADPAHDRLFISDSNHHRIVISTLDGKLIDTIGTGRLGKEDGAYDYAQFDHPQGMCLVGNTLYVADTENHLLRTVDVDTKTVATFAGTGKQARFGAHGGKLLATSLNSPWDVYALDGVLYICMAGPHQIWSHKIGTPVIQPYAGSGREDIIDGLLTKSALAQPSGITSDGKSLFVVDSEGSSVRKISTKKGGSLSEPMGFVETVVGTSDLPNGRCLFEFGDVDGVGGKVRLQHPLGIVFHDGKLFVADSYNHKIKVIDPESQQCDTWFGTGKPGTELDQLSEPAGLTVVGDQLLVADTNNSRILAIDLKSKEAKEFTVEGLTPPKKVEMEETAAVEEADVPASDQTVHVKPGESLPIEIRFDLPEDYKLNELFPVKYTVSSKSDQPVVAGENLAKRKSIEPKEGTVSLSIPVTDKTGKAELTLSLSYGYCREGTGGLCKLATSIWKLAIESTDAAKPAPLTLTASPKQ